MPKGYVRLARMMTREPAFGCRTVAAGDRSQRVRSFRGFALVEGLMGMLIVALVLILTVTVIQRNRQRAAVDRLGGELQELAAVFQDFRQRQSAWPPSTDGEDSIPRGMETDLKDSAWTRETPVGGRYRWVPPRGPESGLDEQQRGWDALGAIGVTAFSPNFPLEISATDLRYLDAKIDDGNLASGRFRTGFNGWPVMLVGEKL